VRLLRGNPIKIEDSRRGGLLVNFKQSGCEGSYALECASGPNTIEAIDEYQRTFKLAVDDGC
jgi:hypothetical protein